MRTVLRTSLLLCAAAAAPATAPTRSRVLRGKYIAPTIRGADCDVTASPYGARGDGRHNDTAAVQRALDDDSCGLVILPAPGRYLVAAQLTISRSHSGLHVPAGATVLVSNDRKRWPGAGNVVSADGVNDIAITGGGTFDGQGLEWWRNRDDFRPHMVQFNHVTNALLSDTLYKDAPNHVLELYCDNCELSGVRVLAPPSTGDCEKDQTCSHNTDAVDVHGTPFFIHDVNFTTGDDNVAAHANHTLVEDSYFGTGHGASIGSLCGDWLHNITFRNITFDGTTCGARIKSHPKCAGHVWDVTYENLTMRGVGQAVDLTQFYEGDGPSTYLFDQIVFKDITVEAGRRRRPDRAIRVGNDDDEPTVAFDCDDHFDGKANCHVAMENVAFVGFDGEKGVGGATMQCKGTVGTAKDVRGITSCLNDHI